MRKFIASLTAAALAIAGAVVVTTPAQAARSIDQLTFETVEGVNGFVLTNGAIEDLSNLQVLDLNKAATPIPVVGENCFHRNWGWEAPPGTTGKEAIEHFQANPFSQDGPCDYYFTVVRQGSGPGEDYWYSQQYSNPYKDEGVSQANTLYPSGKSSYKVSTFDGYWGNLVMEEKWREDTDYNIDDCAAAGELAMVDYDNPEYKTAGWIIDYDYYMYGPVGWYRDYPDSYYPVQCQIKLTPEFEMVQVKDETFDEAETYFIEAAYLGPDTEYSQYESRCSDWAYAYADDDAYKKLDIDSVAPRQNGQPGCEMYLSVAAPTDDFSCYDSKLMYVSIKDQEGVCITPPKAQPGSAEDENFNSLLYPANATDAVGVCGTESYIGHIMNVGEGVNYHDWMHENMALSNYGNGKFADCERALEDLAGDPAYYGMKSITSWDVDNEFFMMEVAPGVPLCATGVNPESGSKRAKHCATAINFSQTVNGYVDPNAPEVIDPIFGVDPDVELFPEIGQELPEPGCEIDCITSIELPALPAGDEFEFVYEPGEAGVCLYDGEEQFTENGVTFCGTPIPPALVPDVEPIQEWTPPPPECWQGPNNCPVGQSIEYTVPPYMMVGVPVNVTVYGTRTVESELGRFNYGQPDNGTAVIHYGDHQDDPPVAGVPFVDGQATFRVVPQEAGEKNFSICGVLNSGTSGGNAYIECVDGFTTVLPYDPEYYKGAFKSLALEKGDKFTIVDADQAKGKAAKRLEWRVAQSDEDVCAVYETKKGKVRAKFNKSGECTVLWQDPKTGETGKIQIG